MGGFGMLLLVLIWQLISAAFAEASFTENLLFKGLKDGKVLAQFHFVNRLSLSTELQEWNGMRQFEFDRE